MLKVNQDKSFSLNFKELGLTIRFLKNEKKNFQLISTRSTYCKKKLKNVFENTMICWSLNIWKFQIL